MNSQQIGLLYIQLTASLFVLATLGYWALKNQEDTRKYKLFAVRDKFLYLAATGVLQQESLVFRAFYGAMNSFVAELDSATIVSFVRASAAARSRLERENKERLRDSLHRSDPRVQGAVDEFIHVVMDALRYNSPMLTVLVAFATHCRRAFIFLRKHSHFRVQIYDTYRFYERIHITLELT